jgi:aspartokinase
MEAVLPRAALQKETVAAASLLVIVVQAGGGVTNALIGPLEKVSKSSYGNLESRDRP